MPGQRNKSARTVAAEVLAQLDPRRDYAGPILDKLLPQTEQKQRATDLVFGTIRNRFAVDTVIATFSGRPVERIPTEFLNIVRLAAYELIYCPETADYSIVNDAVEAAKRIGGKKQTGFVNAVLRQISRRITHRQIQLADADVQRTLAQTPVTGCEFDERFLPDSEGSPVAYLSTVFSLPKWLVADWVNEFGVEKSQQVCFAGNRRPSIYLRPNRLKTNAQALVDHLRRADIDVEIVPADQMIRVESPRAVTELAGFMQGMFSVQDITAWQAVTMLEPQPDWTILDLCAAPGTKTTQLAERTGDAAKIIATDIDRRRLEKVKENTARLGIGSVEIVAYEQVERMAEDVGPFDAILLDVPCSNTGVLARRPEARYRIRQKTIMQLAATQACLLAKAANMIKVGGKICYSTCSIQKAENDGLVKEFLQKNAGFRLQVDQLWLPSAEQFDHDGGYVAILVKKNVGPLAEAGSADA